MNSAKDIGERIKQARLKANKTQRDIFYETGISITQLSAYENGNRNICLKNIAKIAEATDTTIDDLYFGKAETRIISKSKNKGELIINCVTSLVDNDVIRFEYLSKATDSWETTKKLSIISHYFTIQNYVEKYLDFKEHIKDYPDPKNFLNQLKIVSIKQINQSLKK